MRREGTGRHQVGGEREQTCIRWVREERGNRQTVEEGGEREQADTRWEEGEEGKQQCLQTSSVPCSTANIFMFPTG